MVSMRTVEEQLRLSGSRIGLWGRSEVKELCNVLLPGEEIRDCVNGHYLNGFAMLCATNQRIILIDSKPMFLTVEDVRYDMIAEIDYSHRLLDSTIKVFTPTKTLNFTSWNIQRLRRLSMSAQQHVLAIRQFQQAHSQAFSQTYQQNPQPRPITPTPIYAPVNQLASKPMSYFVENNDEKYSIAALAVNHAMTDTASNENLSPVAETGIKGLSSYPVNPFIKSSFKSRNRQWPKQGLITRR